MTHFTPRRRCLVTQSTDSMPGSVMTMTGMLVLRRCECVRVSACLVRITHASHVAVVASWFSAACCAQCATIAGVLSVAMVCDLQVRSRRSTSACATSRAARCTAWPWCWAARATPTSTLSSRGVGALCARCGVCACDRVCLVNVGVAPARSVTAIVDSSSFQSRSPCSQVRVCAMCVCV
jgi:hypothetical protein